MASVTELLQLAEYQAQNKRENSIPGRLASLIEAGMSGYDRGQKIKSAQLDRQIKKLDMEKKQADIQQTAVNRKISNNLAKRLGLLDLNDTEAAVGRSTALDSATVTKPVRDNTSAGRMASIYAGNEEYRVVPGSFSPDKGLTFDFKKAKEKSDTEKDPTTRNARIRQEAEQAARREKYNTIASLVGPEEAQKYANVQPTEDEIQKFIPEMESYLEGDKGKAGTIRESRRAKDKFTNDYIQSLQTQIQDERARLGVNASGGSNTTLYSAFHRGDEAKLENLTKRRDKLIQGGGINEIRNQIKEDLDVLKQDPQTNRAQIVELTKKLLQLAQTGR